MLQCRFTCSSVTNCRVLQEIVLEACLFYYAVIVTSVPCKYLVENLKGIFQRGQTADLDLDMIHPLFWEDDLECAGISGKDIDHLGIEANGCIHWKFMW